MNARFRIVAINAATGAEFECFTWTRDAESGIARAYADAANHGMVIHSARAEAL